MKHHTHFWTIAGICTLATLCVYSLINSSSINAPISLFASFGLYVLFFRVLVGIYRNYVWAWFNRRHDLRGEWIHRVFDNEGKLIRTGTVFITQTYETITISGDNFSSADEDKLVSLWEADSDGIWINEMFINFTYVTNTTLKAVTHKTGKCTLRLDGKKPPKELNGYYADEAPSEEKGAFRLSRKD